MNRPGTDGTVGVRDLKTRFSEYLARASGGEEIVVTDRGRPIARIVAYDSASSIEQGIEEGWVDAPRRTRLEPTVRHRGNDAVLTVLAEGRGPERTRPS
jgi:prevent-host-death family protein